MIRRVLNIPFVLIWEDCQVISEEDHSIEGKEVIEEDSCCHAATSVHHIVWCRSSEERSEEEGCIPVGIRHASSCLDITEADSSMLSNRSCS